MKRETKFSPCRHYRYTLWREWNDMDLLASNALVAALNSDKYLMVIGLNPSTADETKDDPTIRRCVAFAKRWGYGGLCMTNLFAWRDTKPENMIRAEQPIGDENDTWLLDCASEAGLVLAAWGKRGSHKNRAATVERLIPRLYCLRRNGDGSPEHPLYVPADTLPIPFNCVEIAA